MEDIIYDELDCRFALGIKGDKTLFFIGVNPSTGKPGNYDKTMKKIKNIAKENKYNSWIMFNIYPQRSKEKDDIDIDCNEVIHKENLRIINKLIPENSIIVAAWGDTITKRLYLIDCLKDIVKELEGRNIVWKQIGKLTNEGNPRSPLYEKINEKMFDFNIEEYIKYKVK